MSTGQQTRTRSQRVASVKSNQGPVATILEHLQSGAVVLRLLMAVLLAASLMVITRGWSPPRDFHLKQIPARDIVAAVEFKQFDERATTEARAQARRFAEAVYDNDPQALLQLKAKLQNEVTQLVGAESLAAADAELWEMYQPPRAEGTPEPTDEDREAAFERFREALAPEEAREAFDKSLDEVLAPIQRRGILDVQPTEANSERILVRQTGKEGFEPVISVREVLIENVRGKLSADLNQELASLDVARHVFARLRPDLPITLQLNEDATREQQDKVAAAVEDIDRTFEKGARLAEAGVPINETKVELLELGYQERLRQLTVTERVSRAAAVIWLYAALFALCGVGVWKSDPSAIRELSRYAGLLLFVLATVGGIVLSFAQSWQAEIVPLMIFAMTMAVAYRHQTAILLSASVTLIVAIGLGLSLFDSLLLIGPSICSIAMLDTIRHRSKLLVVGLTSGLVAIALALAIGAFESQPVWPTCRLALLTGTWCLVAGSLMTVALPLVERMFRVQTDLSLIELGDPAHHLLQELVRRAPGTYNHSITVASIAEAAAESIGARGLLVRVGAYFHDIGKMLKPGYFIENQGVGGNQHDALVPAMSTLVIIAHVKDGADLARQNRLPEVIIDFILQHHGTTLVEYFYRQAQQKNPDGEDSEVDETSFRYPGPKPQTKEAGVLMLADAVESASRALVEPTPSRIESLVEELIKKRLEDGQFDECGLTLQEVRTIGDSLIKSVTAVYHGRVKYPGQETA